MEYIIHLIQYASYFAYVVLFLIIFLESFPPTLFLPGDSLLFISGFLASQGYLNMGILVGTLFLASVLGYVFSYAMGKKLREFIMKSDDRFWFKKKHLDYTEQFYLKYGTKTVIIGRFVPIVRSFSPTLAGAVDMNYRQFIKHVFVGGFLWIGGLTCVGYYLGRIIPGVEKLLTPIILIIILISLLPVIMEQVFKVYKKYS